MPRNNAGMMIVNDMCLKIRKFSKFIVLVLWKLLEIPDRFELGFLVF